MHDIHSTNHTAGPTQYTLNGIIEHLQDQARSNLTKQNEWLLEKQQSLTQLGKSEGELKALETINTDLIKRVKMLEFCLRQERLKYASLLTNKHIPAPELRGVFENQAQVQNMPLGQVNDMLQNKPKAKSHRTTILKFLEEVGYEELFMKEGEVRNVENRGKSNAFRQNSENMDRSYRLNEDADRSEQMSMLDNSTIRRNPNNRSEIRYNSQDDQSYYTGDERSFRSRANNRSQREQKSAFNNEQNKNTVEWKQKSVLRGHFDGIRDIFVHGRDGLLSSVSEDCMIKVWDLNKLKRSKESSSTLDPYLTLREHTGPLFAMAGPQGENFDMLNLRILYTAGSEGVIRAWNLPTPSECETYGSSPTSFNMGTWAAHEDTIWELNHHPFEHQVMSLSSDGYIKIWETMDTNARWILSNKPRSFFSYRTSSFDQQSYLVPTSAAWVMTRMNQVISGFANSTSLICFDEDTGKPAGSLKYEPYTSVHKLTQPNKVISHPNMGLLMSGHEDKYIRFFDLGSSNDKLVHSLHAHNDAVTSIHYNSASTNLISVSHDGSIKVWDLRKYGLVQELPGMHTRKYDEQIHCVTSDATTQLLLTGGADGLVSIFERC